MKTSTSLRIPAQCPLSLLLLATLITVASCSGTQSSSSPAATPAPSSHPSAEEPSASPSASPSTQYIENSLPLAVLAYPLAKAVALVDRQGNVKSIPLGAGLAPTGVFMSHAECTVIVRATSGKAASLLSIDSDTGRLVPFFDGGLQDGDVFLSNLTPSGSGDWIAYLVASAEAASGEIEAFHVEVVPLDDSAPPLRLTANAISPISALAWSKGDDLAFTDVSSDGLPQVLTAGSPWLSTVLQARLTDSDVLVGQIAWSPDSSRIALSLVATPFAGPAPSELRIIDLKGELLGTASLVGLSAGQIPSFWWDSDGHLVVDSLGSDESPLLTWLDGSDAHVLRQIVPEAAGVLSAFAFPAGRNRVGFLGQDSSLYLLDPTTGAAALWVKADALPLGEPNAIAGRASDNQCDG